MIFIRAKERLAVLLCLLLAWTTACRAKDELRLRGRLMVRYQIEDEERTSGRWTDTFTLHRIRLDGRWKLDELRLNLELEAADGLELADAYVRYDFFKQLRLSAGHFKKPLSRLHLTSRWDLVIPRRGMLDNLAVGQGMFGGYGGRDVGLMLWGRWGKKPRLEYYAGIFDGGSFLSWAFQDPQDPPGATNASHRDYVGRLAARFFRGLELGVSYGHKQAGIIYAPGEESRRYFNLVEGDLLWTVGDFSLQVEGAWGDNPNAMAGHKLAGGHALVWYRQKLNDDLALLPALMVEYLDPDDALSGGDAWRLAGALNLDVGKHTRLVLAAEGGWGEYRFETPEYVTEKDLRAAQKYRDVPLRVLMQLNVTL